jgi:dienelactone hydrolase
MAWAVGRRTLGHRIDAGYLKGVMPDAMPDFTRRPPEALVPLVAGLSWLWLAASFGVVGFLFSMLPGCLLLSCGVAMLLWPGDLRIPQFAAVGGLLGVPLAVPAIWVAGPGVALALIALSVASFLTAGRMSVRQEPRWSGVPEPRGSLGLYAQVAADDALLAWMQITLDVRSGEHLPRIAREVRDAAELFDARGWLEKPADYHSTPPPLTEPEARTKRVRRIPYEHLVFESGYEPHPDEPGRERWLGYAANRTAHAWVVRHAGEPRPWIVCLHGFQMGWPGIDLLAFAPEYFHKHLGLNLAVPVLPLHGPRHEGKRSGDGFLAGDPLDSIHAEAQSMWDVRRLLSWIRAQGAPGVGVMGLSLGGYQTSLLACLDDELACAIPGIPLTDIARAVWRHGPSLHLTHAEHHGVVHDEFAEILRVVSPLVLEPKVPHEHRAIFGGIGDQLVPPDQVRDLWEHWDRPRIEWYQGAHLTFRAHRGVRRLIPETLAGAGLLDPDRARGPLPRLGL